MIVQFIFDFYKLIIVLMNSIVTLTNLLTPVKNKKREYDKSTNSSLYNSAIFTQKS